MIYCGATEVIVFDQLWRVKRFSTGTNSRSEDKERKELSIVFFYHGFIAGHVFMLSIGLPCMAHRQWFVFHCLCIGEKTKPTIG